MKKLFTVVVCLFLAGYAVAQDLYPEAPIWNVPKADVAPVIDGLRDNVWVNAGEEILDNLDPSTEAPANWFDLFGAARVLYDDVNLYIWVSLFDDVIVEGADHMFDGVEVYFDGDNSKMAGAYDGVDDVQLRFNHGDDVADVDVSYGGATDWGFTRDGIAFVQTETTLGWDMEISIPLASVQLATGTEFGFDLQINECDVEGTRKTMYRWWGTDNEGWHMADRFGTAILTDRTAGEVLDVVKISTAPVIDGIADDVWADVPKISDNLDADTDPANIDDWSESRFWFKTYHDGVKQYFWLDVWDDVLMPGVDHTVDSMEIYWDGNNSKTVAAYDGVDDYQLRVHTGDTTNDQLNNGFAGADWTPDPRDGVVFSTVESDHGFVVEMSMELASVQLVEDSPFGFEVQSNDNDSGVRDGMRRWWSSSNESWHDASYFGTANLMPAGAGVIQRNTMATEFALAQNYPNPFNPSTVINYSVINRSMVTLNVYDVLGKQVASIVNQVQAPGQYAVSFDGSDLTSGVYFYKLMADNKIETRKMMLVK